MTSFTTEGKLNTAQLELVVDGQRKVFSVSATNPKALFDGIAEQLALLKSRAATPVYRKEKRH